MNRETYLQHTTSLFDTPATAAIDAVADVLIALGGVCAHANRIEAKLKERSIALTPRHQSALRDFKQQVVRIMDSVKLLTSSRAVTPVYCKSFDRSLGMVVATLRGLRPVVDDNTCMNILNLVKQAKLEMDDILDENSEFDTTLKRHSRVS